MNKNRVLTVTSIALFLLGVAMIYIGGFHAPEVILPPVITGVGFFILAWALKALRE